MPSQWYTSAATSSNSLDVEGLPEELLRGISPRNLLASFGRVIRIRPDTLNDEMQTQLFDLSECTKTLQFFLSHCWGAPGWQKYIALLFHFSGAWACLGSFLAALSVLGAQRFLYELPNFSKCEDGFFNLTWEISQWEFYAGIVTFYAILFFGHLFQQCSSGFLDCACIHQTDKAKKLLGITHLASFLRASAEMIILWDPLYFSRGWCGYELASYLALNAEGCVRVIPLSLQVEIAAVNVYFLFGMASFLMLWPFIPAPWGHNFLVFLSMGMCFVFLAFSGEKYQKSRATLLSQINAFDITKADVQVEQDRKVIVSHIEAMYPNGGVLAFNKTVRTEIKSVVVKESSAQFSHISYKTAFLMSTPGMAFCMSGLSSFRHLPAPFQVAYLIYGTTNAGAQFPVAAAVAMLLGGRFAKYASQPDAAGIGLRHFYAGTITSAGFTLWNTMLFHLPLGIAAGVLPQISAQPWHGPLIGASVSAITWSMAAWIFKPKTKPQLQRSLSYTGYTALSNNTTE